MIHPVTVKDSAGVVLKIFTSEFLEERSTAICMEADGHFSSHKLRDDLCGREVCRKPFWTRQRGKKYCSRDCTNIVARATALATKQRAREKRLKEKENQ